MNLEQKCFVASFTKKINRIYFLEARIVSSQDQILYMILALVPWLTNITTSSPYHNYGKIPTQTWLSSFRRTTSLGERKNTEYITIIWSP